jgi:N-acetylneuraminic acid mutarotase
VKKKGATQFAFFQPRVLFALVVCTAAAGSMLSGTLLAFFHSQAPTKVSQRTLTFPQRVFYQRAIEEVYWRHRIWPKENPGPKPPLDAMISREQIEKKVTDYLRKSQLLADERGRPITPSELQTEMDRMAKHTKQPEVLRELFEAFGNDPFLIAECLVRPISVEQALRELTNCRDAAPTRPLFSPYDSARPTVAPYQNFASAAYKLPEISVALSCADDTWTPTATVNAPDVREFYPAVWTGSEMIVWGGFNFSPPYRLNTGGRYDPVTDSWMSISLVNAPSPRDYHSAVWTGTQMIVWGGESTAGNIRQVNTGGRYNPITDGWTATSTANAPAARAQHTAVWTGSEMIVWGGFSDLDNWFNTGGRYNPNTDSWSSTSTTNAPEARWDHTVEWTGSEMVVWGGTNQTIYLNSGGRYNPSTDSWTPTGLANAPLGRIAHTGVWTGSEIIVWGGVDINLNDLNTGGRYNPTGDSWTPISTISAPSARDSHTAVWTGTEMVVWGGEFGPPGVSLDTGGTYSSGTDSWLATSMVSAPHARDSHTAVWTGSEMIVWGGAYWVGGNRVFLNTGGRYCAQPSATPRLAPSPRPRPTPPPRP